MFFLIKLPFLLIMLPFKIIAELAEHSGHRRHYRRPRRISWLPGQAGLSRWTRQVTRAAAQDQQDPVRRYALRPLTMVAVGFAWVMLVYAWLVWWMLLIVLIPLGMLA